jgi:hypothetical protein
MEWLTDSGVNLLPRQSLSDILRDMSHERYLMLSGKMYATMKARIELIKVLGEELSEMMQSVE